MAVSVNAGTGRAECEGSGDHGGQGSGANDGGGIASAALMSCGEMSDVTRRSPRSLETRSGSWRLGTRDSSQGMESEVLFLLDGTKRQLGWGGPGSRNCVCLDSRDANNMGKSIRLNESGNS